MISTWSFWSVILLGGAWVAWGPARWREPGLALLAAALIAWNDWIVLLIYVGLVTAVWVLVQGGRRPARVALVTVGVLAAGLVACKWAKVLEDGVVMPLGLSYLIFRLIHVLVEAERAQLTPVTTWSEFAHYLLSPALFSAGPLERWDHFVGERKDTVNGTVAAEAMQRIALGLVKKLLLADSVLIKVAAAAGAGDPGAFTSRTPPSILWLAALLSYVRIYTEFSGYSDIAVGAGLLWGRRIMENFNWPILAVTPSDFWRRWHISLSQWCSRYIYMPAIGRLRNPLLPMFGSFLVMGLWHLIGWNRVGWAIYQTVGVLVYLGWSKAMGRVRSDSWRARWPWRVVSCLMTQAFVTVSYVFAFRRENVPLQSTLELLGRMFGGP